MDPDSFILLARNCIYYFWKFQVFEEKAYLVGVARKGDKEDSFGIEESLKELAQLADTAGLMVVDSTYQKCVLPLSQVESPFFFRTFQESPLEV